MSIESWVIIGNRSLYGVHCTLLGELWSYELTTFGKYMRIDLPAFQDQSSNRKKTRCRRAVRAITRIGLRHAAEYAKMKTSAIDGDRLLWVIICVTFKISIILGERFVITLIMQRSTMHLMLPWQTGRTASEEVALSLVEFNVCHAYYINYSME